MGNASIYLQKYDIVRFFKRQDWIKLSVNHHYQIWRHKYTHQTAEVYQLHDVPSIEDMNIYDFRNKYEQLVRIYFLAFDQHLGICGNQHQLEILVQHVPYKLEELDHLTQEEALTVFMTTLKGFKLIEEQFGPVEPSEELVGVNGEGKAKVWLNKNPTLNFAQKQSRQFISDKFSSVSIRIRKLYSIVEQKCQDMFLPYSVKQKFCNRNIAYSDAIFLVQEYAKSSKLSLSKYLGSDVILQKLVKSRINRGHNGGKEEINNFSISKQIQVQNRFVSQKREEVSGKTLKKTVSLINMNRPHSSLNNSDSRQHLNHSRVVVFNNPRTAERRVQERPNWANNSPVMQIRFVHNNTPTKIFYSPKHENKYSLLQTGTSQQVELQTNPFRVVEERNTDIVPQQVQAQEHMVEQNIEADKPAKIKTEESEVAIATEGEGQLVQDKAEQQQNKPTQEQNRCLPQNVERSKQLFTTFGNQKESELFRFRETQLRKLRDYPATTVQHQKAQSGEERQKEDEAVISPCFNSTEFVDKRHVCFAEVLQQNREQTQKKLECPPYSGEIQSAKSQENPSLESIDSMGVDRKRKRTSIFAALQVDYANLIGEDAPTDEVKEGEDLTSKQMVFGSFSKIGSFNIVRIDSMLQKKYEEAITKEDKENKFKTAKKQAKPVAEHIDQQDFLNVDYLQKSLDKRYSPHLSKRAVQKQPEPEEDNLLDIGKLEEGLLKFSKYQGNQNQVQQIEEYSITVKQPEDMVVQKINFLQANPANSIRVAESDSHRIDNQWEISDTSINMAIINNKQKEREESLKRTSSSSRFQFYQSIGRKTGNYQPHRYFDTSFTKQPRYYNTWQVNKKYNIFQSNMDKYKKDYEFEEKYKKHVQLRAEYSRPTTSYQSNYQQLQRSYQPKEYGTINQKERELQREVRYKNQVQAGVKQAPVRKLTYDQLRQILWN